MAKQKKSNELGNHIAAKIDQFHMMTGYRFSSLHAVKIDTAAHDLFSSVVFDQLVTNLLGRKVTLSTVKEKTYREIAGIYADSFTKGVGAFSVAAREDLYDRNVAGVISDLERSKLMLYKTDGRLVEEMLDQIPVEVWQDADKTWADFCCGTGEFIVRIARRLAKHHSWQHIIENMIYFNDINPNMVEVTKFRLALYGNYKYNCWSDDFILEDKTVIGKGKNKLVTVRDFCYRNNIVGKKFDVIVGNPPFNFVVGNGGKSGNIGDKHLYKKFTSKCLTLLEDKGYLVYVTLKGILEEFEKQDMDNFQVEKVSLMTNSNYWHYNTCFFLIKNIKKTYDYVVIDHIISKIYSVREGFPYKVLPMSDMQLVRDLNAYKSNGKTKVIRKLPGKNNDLLYDYTDLETVNGPHLVFKYLESEISYTATDTPVIGDCIISIKTNTVTEAEILKNFILFNKAYKFLCQKIKPKSRGRLIRYTKFFDLSKMTTGLEYPVEWNLTNEEIEYIEKSV